MRKLQLRRETVRALQDAALQDVVGGSTSNSIDSCGGTWNSACPGSVLNSCNHPPRIPDFPTDGTACVC